MVLVVLLTAIAISPVFKPGSHSRTGEDLPWQITLDVDRATVFTLTLGNSTLASAIDKLGQRYELALFQDKNQHFSLEAYFRAVSLGGLSARMVLKLTPPQGLIENLTRDGNPGQITPSGSRRHNLPEVPPAALLRTPIGAITYVPMVSFETALVEKQLGLPASTLGTVEHILHWLYPELGLAVSWEEGQTVFQYVEPINFREFHERLIETTGIGE